MKGYITEKVVYLVYLNGSKTIITIDILLVYFALKKNAYFLDFVHAILQKIYPQCEWWYENVQNGQFKKNQSKEKA